MSPWKWDSTMGKDAGVYTAEKLLSTRRLSLELPREYLVKWVGYTSDANSWEPEDNILSLGLIEEFEAERREAYETERANKRLAVLKTALKGFGEEPKPIKTTPYELDHYALGLRTTNQKQREYKKIEATTIPQEELERKLLNKKKGKKKEKRNGFDRGLQLEAIRGRLVTNDGVLYVMKWQGIEKPELMPDHIVKQYIPRFVLKSNTIPSFHHKDCETISASDESSSEDSIFDDQEWTMVGNKVARLPRKV